MSQKPRRKFKPQYEKENGKFDVEKWIKQNSNIEHPRRSKANSLGEKKKRRSN